MHYNSPNLECTLRMIMIKVCGGQVSRASGTIDAATSSIISCQVRWRISILLSNARVTCT